jgi:hypothetical protein
MQPDPKHLKNFARNTQWSRGNIVRNSLFLNRSHLPGLERLNARGLVCHLIRAIGHHIDRLACRSNIIMARLRAGWETYPDHAHHALAQSRRTGTGSVNYQSCKLAVAKFVPER